MLTVCRSKPLSHSFIFKWLWSCSGFPQDTAASHQIQSPLLSPNPTQSLSYVGPCGSHLLSHSSPDFCTLHFPEVLPPSPPISALSFYCLTKGSISQDSVLSPGFWLPTPSPPLFVLLSHRKLTIISSKVNWGWEENVESKGLASISVSTDLVAVHPRACNTPQLHKSEEISSNVPSNPTVLQF